MTGTSRLHMRRVVGLAAVAVVATGALAAAPATRAFAVAPASGADAHDHLSRVDARLFHPGTAGALVHVSPGTRLGQVARAVSALGLRPGTRYRSIGVFVAYGSAEDLARAADLDGVTFVEANTPLDHSLETARKATRADAVHAGNAPGLPRGFDGTGVGVAVVDTGVDGTHPDLVDNMAGNVRIVCSSPGTLPDGQPDTECQGTKEAVEVPDSDTIAAGGHGTHVAGIVASTGETSSGEIKGTAPGASVYGVGIGTGIFVENALDGLQWVLENHDRVDPPIRIVNNSWGGGYAPADENDPYSGSVTKMTNALVAAGVTVVYAAGNEGGVGTIPTTTMECVNQTPGVICVANFDDKDSGARDGSIWESSSRGARDDPTTWPDVAAPGTTIRSTCRPTLPICVAEGYEDPSPYYATFTGTSMAAPHVSGIAALLYEADPGLRPAEVEAILENTAYQFKWGSPYKRDPANPRTFSSLDKGHGLVDALAAVRAVLSR